MTWRLSEECKRCEIEKLGRFNWTSDAHSGNCPNAYGRATTLVRDANSGGGPLAVMSFCDLADLVSLFAPYDTAACDAFFAALRARTDCKLKR